MAKVIEMNSAKSQGSAFRAILAFLQPIDHPLDGPLLREHVKAVSKAGERFDKAIAHLIKKNFVDEVEVVTYRMPKRERHPELPEAHQDIIHVLRLSEDVQWHELEYCLNWTVSYNALLDLIGSGIVVSEVKTAYVRKNWRS